MADADALDREPTIIEWAADLCDEIRRGMRVREIALARLINELGAAGVDNLRAADVIIAGSLVSEVGDTLRRAAQQLREPVAHPSPGRSRVRVLAQLSPPGILGLPTSAQGGGRGAAPPPVPWRRD